MIAALIAVAETPSDPLVQYGVLGAVFAAVLGGIVVPIVNAMLKQNAEALTITREAVQAFAKFEDRIEDNHREVISRLDQLKRVPT